MERSEETQTQKSFGYCDWAVNGVPGHSPEMPVLATGLDRLCDSHRHTFRAMTDYYY